MMRNAALLIIDAQQGMFTLSKPMNRADEVLAAIRSLVRRARKADAPVIFVQHDGGPDHPLEKPNSGWHIHLSTGFRSGDFVIEKQVCDSFADRRLQDHLANLGVRTLVIAGLQTEYCVDTACRRAASLGYEVILALDAHTTCDSKTLLAEQIISHHNKVLSDQFVVLRASESIYFEQCN